MDAHLTGSSLILAPTSCSSVQHLVDSTAGGWAGLVALNLLHYDRAGVFVTRENIWEKVDLMSEHFEDTNVVSLAVSLAISPLESFMPGVHDFRDSGPDLLNAIRNKVKNYTSSLLTSSFWCFQR